MNSRSGIKVSQDLKNQIQEANLSTSSSRVRAFMVTIERGELIVSKTIDRSGTQTSDFNNLASSLPSRTSPVFILFFKDQATSAQRDVFTGKTTPSSSSAVGSPGKKSKVIAILYCPDSAEVKQKMVYSSTWGTLRDVAGEGAEEYQANTASELTYSSFQNLHGTDESLLSEVEKLRNKEDKMDIQNVDDVKEAGGYNLIALSKGAKGGVPKVVLDSVSRANAQRGTGLTSLQTGSPNSVGSGGDSAKWDSARSNHSISSAKSSGSPVAAKKLTASPRTTTKGTTYAAVTKTPNATTATPVAVGDGMTVKPSNIKQWPPL